SQRFRPPVHLSKPYHDREADLLLVNLACPTAGLLEGDRVDCEFVVSRNGALVLTTPGATRAHVMRSGKAVVKQRFVLEKDAFLEFAPGMLILQRDACLSLRSTVEIAPNSELIFTESIAPGRVARGEIFQFREFSNQLSIKMGGKPIVRENYLLRPDDSSVTSWRNAFPEPFYASFYLFSPKVEEDLPARASLHDLGNNNLLIGVTRLHRSGWMIKLLAADAITLRKAMGTVRSTLYLALDRLEPSFRRY
ncbi:MAG: urease accessory protein UreD, partial [Opitutales bacterium]